MGCAFCRLELKRSMSLWLETNMCRTNEPKSLRERERESNLIWRDPSVFGHSGACRLGRANSMPVYWAPCLNLAA